MSGEWYADHRNLAALARHMVAEGDEENVVYMLEKPWKYDEEWRAIKDAAPCPSCERDLSYPGMPGHVCYQSRT